MKITQLAALFGGTALAVQPLAAPRVERALTDTHSTVVMVTSTYLVSEICTEIASCPPYTTTAETSVVYVTATTTICLLSSTPPGYGPPATAAAPSSVASPAYPTGSAGISISLIPGSSIPPVSSEYLSGSAPQTSALPTGASSSGTYAAPPSVSAVLPSAPYSSGVIVVTDVFPLPGSSSGIAVLSSTNTDAISTSYPVSSTEPGFIGSSSGYAALPGSSLLSSYTNPAPVNPGSPTISSMSYPGSVPPSSSATLPLSNTDVFPTSLSASSSGFSSGNSAAPSTPGYVSSGPALPSSSNTDAVPTSSGVTSTGSLSSGYIVPSGGSATLSISSTGAVSISLTVSLPTGPASSGYAMSSSYSANPSGPVRTSSSRNSMPPSSLTSPASSNTDAVPTSLTTSSPGASSADSSSSRDFPLPESSGPPLVSVTDAVPTSLPSGGPSAEPSSSNYFVSPGSSIEDAPIYTGDESTSLTATGFSGTVSGTYPVTLSTTLGYPSPSPPTGPDSTVMESTIRITSHQTQTFTSYITAGPSSGGPVNSTDTNTQAVPTSFPSGVSGHHSGSGYPYPSAGINGTIVAPFPSYVEVPINNGHIVGAGKSSLAAIVVALVFAHFA